LYSGFLKNSFPGILQKTARGLLIVKRIRIIAVIISCLLISAYLVFINDIAISIRLIELTTSLQDLDRTERSIDHIGLIATYELNKKMYENRLTQELADALEHTINSLMIKEKKNPGIMRTKYGIISLPAIGLMNFNRKILGKKPLRYSRDQDTALVDLDIAYYLERNYLFERAITLYEKTLEDRKISNTLRASILLHQGYCYALSGFNDKARKNYLEIGDKYPLESSAVTAAILLRYLEGFQTARERILSSHADPVSISQNLVNLLAYKQALQILQEAEAKANPNDIPRIKYYMARCFTGMGEPEKAAENYIQIITSSPASEYARYSNRKLFLIGSRSSDKNIIKISEQLNSKINDPVLSQMIHDQEDIEYSVPEVLVKVNLPQKITENVDKFAKGVETIPPAAAKLLIITSDGNTFKGTLIEQTDTEVSIQTSIGRINVKKNKITKMTAMK